MSKLITTDTPSMIRHRSQAYRDSLAVAIFEKGKADGFILCGIHPQYTGFLWWKKFIGYIAVIEYECPNPFFYFRTGAGASPQEALNAAIDAL